RTSRGRTPRRAWRVAFRARSLLVGAGAALAALELRQHLAQRDAVPGEHDHAMEDEVRGLVHDRAAIAALRGDHGLDRLLGDFLEDLVLSLGMTRSSRKSPRRR